MDTNLNSEPVKNNIKLDFKESKYATGRRKKSIARVWLKKGSGLIYVNGKKMIDYFICKIFWFVGHYSPFQTSLIYLF